MANLRMTTEDARLLLAAQVHVGERNAHFQMRQYLVGRNKNGAHIINIEKTWEKMVLAARAIAAVTNPQDVSVVGTANNTSRAVLKCCRYMNAFPFAGRFTPGTFTNQIQRAFREPLLLLCHDPKNDHQAINEASYVNIPVIAFCDADSSPRLVDIVIPCNTRDKQSIGLMFWMLTREVKRMRGDISRDQPWDVMVDLFFYRSPDEQERELELEGAGAGVSMSAGGVMASMAGGAGTGMLPPTAGGADDEWTGGWDNEAGTMLQGGPLPGGAPQTVAAAAGGQRGAGGAGPVQGFGAVGGPATVQAQLPTGTDWSTVNDDWNEAPTSWN